MSEQARSYFDVVRSMTNDPAVLAAVNQAERESADVGLRARVTALADWWADGNTWNRAAAAELHAILAGAATEETTPAVEVERRDVWHDVLGCGERFHPEGSTGWQCPHPPIDGHEERTVTPWKRSGGVVVSRLEDAAKALDEMAADDEGCALNSYGDGRKFWLKERDQHTAQAALLRAIDQIPRFGVGSIASDTFAAALALADTLLPTEGTKP